MSNFGTTKAGMHHGGWQAAGKDASAATVEASQLAGVPSKLCMQFHQTDDEVMVVGVPNLHAWIEK